LSAAPPTASLLPPFGLFGNTPPAPVPNAGPPRPVPAGGIDDWLINRLFGRR
jgi:hypothetical protein